MATIYEEVEQLKTDVAALQQQISPVNFVTGQEVVTNEKFDGKIVYCKTVDVGALPNAGNKNVASGLNIANITVIKVSGIARNAAGTSIPLPNPTPNNNYSVGCFVSSAGNVALATAIDRSEYSGIVRIYYVYNESEE